MRPVTPENLGRWLEQYGHAWENGDADSVVQLFTPDARYEETPFDPAMVGHDAIHTYWSEGAGQAQKEVHFSFDVVGTAEAIGIAHWKAEFVRIPSGNRVKLDGILIARFAEDGRCQTFREWWHRQESAA